MNLLSQMNYGFGNGLKPVVIGEGDAKQSVASYPDLQAIGNMAEETLGQVITQFNKSLIDQEAVIVNNVPSELDTGTATAAQCAAAINQIITILTNLNSQPK